MAFINNIAIDDLDPETIVRFACASVRIDGDSPASIKSYRRYRTLLRTRVEGAPPVRPLRLGASGLGGHPGFARRAHLAAARKDGCLCQCPGRRQSDDGDKHAQYCPHYLASLGHPWLTN